MEEGDGRGGEGRGGMGLIQPKINIDLEWLRVYTHQTLSGDVEASLMLPRVLVDVIPSLQILFDQRNCIPIGNIYVLCMYYQVLGYEHCLYSQGKQECSSPLEVEEQCRLHLHQCQWSCSCSWDSQRTLERKSRTLVQCIHFGMCTLDSRPHQSN